MDISELIRRGNKVYRATIDYRNQLRGFHTGVPNPMTSDFTYVEKVYAIAKEKYPTLGGEFVIATMYIYSPYTIMGERNMPSGLRKVITRLRGCSPSTISHELRNSIRTYLSSAKRRAVTEDIINMYSSVIEKERQ